VPLLVCRCAPRWVVQRSPRGPAGFGSSARDRPSAPEEQKTERTRLSRLFHWGSAPSARQASLPDRGVREKPYAECRLPTRFRVHKFNLLRVQWGAMRRYRHRPQCVCDSEVALWSRDCRQSSFSQVKLSENRRKQFHFKRRAHCVQHRFQRFPTVRTVGEIGNGEVRAKMPDIRACASTAM